MNTFIFHTFTARPNHLINLASLFQEVKILPRVEVFFCLYNCLCVPPHIPASICQAASTSRIIQFYTALF